MPEIASRVYAVIVLVLSLSVHEWAHAATAVHLGDDTPIRQGRYTLNPLAHIDWLGTIFLPLIGAPIGWAKPVQWNPSRIRRDVPARRALWLVSIAGPASNVVIALIAAVILVLTVRFDFGGSTDVVQRLSATFLGMNVALAIFNMLPIPPLDGSRIVDANIPRSLESKWALVHQYAPYIFLLLMIVNMQTNILSGPITLMTNAIVHVASRMVGL